MKKLEWILAFLLVGALPTALVSPPAAEAAQRSYTLACKGGGGMRIRILMHTSLRYSSGEGTSVLLRFRRSANAATKKQPKPGECAWLNRPVRPKEPELIHWEGAHFLALRAFTFKADSKKIDWGNLKWTYANPPERVLIEAAVNPNRVFYLQVYNDDRDRFRVTRIGQ